jgi:hypothetical protein
LLVGQLQGLRRRSRVVKRRGTIVWIQSEIDMVPPSLVVHSIDPVLQLRFEIGTYGQRKQGQTRCNRDLDEHRELR